MAYVFGLGFSRHIVKHVLTEDAVAHVGIDGEVTDTEAGEVLEEVGALGGVNMEVGKAGFDDDFGGGDIGPFHRDSEPRVTTAPTTGTNEEVVTVVAQELTVETLDFIGYLLGIGGVEVLGLDVDDIGDVGEDAMTDGVVTAHEAGVVGNEGEVFVELHGVIDHGAYLKEVEFASLIGTEVDGKLDFNGTCHLLLSVEEYLAEGVGEGDDVVLEDAGKADYLTVLAFVEAVVDALVVGVEGGAYPTEGAVALGIAHGDGLEVEGVVDLEGQGGGLCGLKGVEAGLGLAQGYVGLAHLEYLVGMGWADAQGESAIDDVFAKAEGEVDDAFGGLFVAYGVVVDAAGYAGDGGVVAGVVLLSDDFLKDDCHLLLIDDVGGGCHVVFGGAIEDGGIDALDGVGKEFEALVFVVGEGYHVGGVDACEGLVVAVLEERGGAYG